MSSRVRQDGLLGRGRTGESERVNETPRNYDRLKFRLLVLSFVYFGERPKSMLTPVPHPNVHSNVSPKTAATASTAINFHPNPEFFGIIYPGFSRDPRKHGPRNISRPLKNRPRLSETPVDAVETRLLMGPQLARSPLFQAGLRAWPDGRTFQPPSQCSPHPFARPSSPAPTSSPATGGTRFRPQSAGRASAGPAAGAPSSSVSR